MKKSHFGQQYLVLRRRDRGEEGIQNKKSNGPNIFYLMVSNRLKFLFALLLKC